jgi:hypothetical protein
LYDLAVVHKEVHLGAVVLDVPGENLRFCRFKHHLLQTEGVDDLGLHVGSLDRDIKKKHQKHSPLAQLFPEEEGVSP